MMGPALIALSLLWASVLNAYAFGQQSVTVQGRLTCCVFRDTEQGLREPLQQQSGPNGPTAEGHNPRQEPAQRRHKRDGSAHGEFNRPQEEWQPKEGDQGGLPHYGTPGWVSPPGLKPVRDNGRDRDFRQDSRDVPDRHAWAQGSWEDRNVERRREEQDDWRRPPEGTWDRAEDRSSHQEQWGVEEVNGRFGQLEQAWGDGNRGQKLPDNRQWQEQDGSAFSGRRKHDFDSEEQEGPSGPLPLNWRHKRLPTSHAQCFDEPQQNVLIQLYTEDMDDLPAETRTDRKGDFKLTANETEVGSIKPYLIIKHHCSKAVAEELIHGCSFVTHVDVPKEYVDDNPFEINSLEALMKSGHSVSTKKHCP